MIINKKEVSNYILSRKRTLDEKLSRLLDEGEVHARVDTDARLSEINNIAANFGIKLKK